MNRFPPLKPQEEIDLEGLPLIMRHLRERPLTLAVELAAVILGTYALGWLLIIAHAIGG